ncbi:MAG: VCBS repeat-containing protein [Dokdonella sp.]
MQWTSLTRLATAVAVAGLLSGFTFTRQHITEAAPVDPTAPFFGSGLVIGPEQQLANVVKHVPLKMRAYKWLLRKGDTQYIPGLRRETDCSLSELYVDLANYTIAQTRARFEDGLRVAAGLAGPAGSYPNGCADPVVGIAAQYVAGGRLPNGNFYGAGPDFHQDQNIVVYLSDGQTLLDQHDIVLAPSDSTQQVESLAVGDFNHDGYPDYAVTMGAYGANASARLAILLGDGVGGYSTPTYYTLISAAPGSNSPAGAGGFTIADFNGDTFPDIAVTAASGSSQNLLVLFGQGDGTFAAPSSVASGVTRDVVSADFNGDGKLDLGTGDGQILFGDGSGSFALQDGQRFPSGRLAVGDFNHDGHADLVIYPQSGDGTPVYIYLGDGSGHFTQAGSGYATGYGAGIATLAVTDIDGDGNADVVIGSAGAGLYGPSINTQGQTHFLLGRGDGSLASPPLFDNAVMVVADFNRDGHADLLALDASGVHPLLGDGAGNFQAGTSSAIDFSSGNGSAQAWLALDLNGDGKMDLVATQSSPGLPSGFIHTRLGNGDGTFHANGGDLATTFATGSYGYGNASIPAVADFDGDGKKDLAIVGYSTTASALYLIRGNGDGSLQTPQAVDTNLIGNGNPPGSVATADFNGDGHADLVVADAGRPFDSTPVTGGVRVYRNQGAGSFDAAVVLPGPMYPEGLAVGDVNGDGHADIVVTSAQAAFGTDTLYVFLGNGDGTFQGARTQVLDDAFYQSIAIADADGDGKADLVLANCCGLTFARFARGDGTGNFSLGGILPLTVSPSGLMLADLRGSGHPDLLALGGDSFAPRLRVFLNTFRDFIFQDGFESN